MPTRGALHQYAADKLWREGTLEDWLSAIDPSVYSKAVEIRRPNDDKLVQAELMLSHVQSELRKNQCLKKTSELRKIMEWKLSRGTHRPRLLNLISQNDDSLVETTTEKAIEILKTKQEEFMHSAISELSTNLHGVGPATASAILSLADECVPFMADEAMTAIPSLPTSKYTLHVYLDFVKEIDRKIQWLNDSRLTPRLVSDTLWAIAWAGASTKKRKRDHR